MSTISPKSGSLLTNASDPRPASTFNSLAGDLVRNWTPFRSHLICRSRGSMTFGKEADCLCRPGRRRRRQRRAANLQKRLINSWPSRGRFLATAIAPWPLKSFTTSEFWGGGQLYRDEGPGHRRIRPRACIAPFPEFYTVSNAGIVLCCAGVPLLRTRSVPWPTQIRSTSLKYLTCLRYLKRS